MESKRSYKTIICYAVYKTLLLKEDNNIEENLKNYKTKNNEK